MSDSDPAPSGAVAVVVIGSINTDLLVRVERHPRPGETVLGGPTSISPGGKGANQALAAARLGARTALVGAVGTDDEAELATALLREAGVHLTGVRTRGWSPSRWTRRRSTTRGPTTPPWRRRCTRAGFRRWW